VVVLLNCGDSSANCSAVRRGSATCRGFGRASARGPADLRTYGIGAQILRDLHVGAM